MTSLLLASLIFSLAGSDAPSSRQPEPTPFVRALWLVQTHGTAEALDPGRDRLTKATLAKALGKDGILKAPGVKGLMKPETFSRLAGADGNLDRDEMKQALESATPESRKFLNPVASAHLDGLCTSFDLIDEPHRLAARSLAEWIAENHRPGEPLGVIVVCTGNSRRSILGSTMGNLAAAYCGLPEIRFSSGGTAPTAFNPRTVKSLREIGVSVEPTGKEAPRGEPKTENPEYKVTWGKAPKGFESVEFSKLYSDPTNPQKGFAALMVCSEADAGCPVVPGASLRLSMPYLDPKLFDDSAYEADKYRERRDDIGRTLLWTLLEARQLITNRTK